MTHDPLTILLAHDRWATHQLLDACGGLTPEQFHQPFEMGPGSLHNTVEHILGAMRFCADLVAGREPRPRLEVPNSRRTVPELRALLDECHDEFDALATSLPLDGQVKRTRNGQTYTFTRGAVVAHVMTHGTHHRAQALNMLRRLGVSPLPKSAVMEWMAAEHPPVPAA
jgi:uncharacterized damage-inducible protein DinB